MFLGGQRLLFLRSREHGEAPDSQTWEDQWYKSLPGCSAPPLTLPRSVKQGADEWRPPASLTSGSDDYTEPTAQADRMWPRRPSLFVNCHRQGRCDLIMMVMTETMAASAQVAALEACQATPGVCRPITAALAHHSPGGGIDYEHGSARPGSNPAGPWDLLLSKPLFVPVCEEPLR